MAGKKRLRQPHPNATPPNPPRAGKHRTFQVHHHKGTIKATGARKPK